MTRAQKIAIQGQFKHCPACGHTEGFHVMLSQEKDKDSKLRMFLICPMCSAVYDSGLKVEGKTE